MLRLHADGAWLLVGVNAVAGVAALVAHWRPSLRHRAVWWLVLAGWVTVAAQVLLGVYLTAGEDLEAPEFHEFYGFVALISVGLIYSYRSQVRQLQYLLYGLGALFLMGLGLRAVYLA
ncbi:MAG: hypothetical protein KDB35_11445 [Acidimicrobiales bacterium]|nr:hypothetical protein [Acidimicrobiales bacterium]MCB1014185.1 hypothetical protein [Acidimicrobiales bacterium]MCB9372004.1 hypothetical protein [Microthrixaceae bacterium]